jgi:HEAT repeat protein
MTSARVSVCLAIGTVALIGMPFAANGQRVAPEASKPIAKADLRERSWNTLKDGAADKDWKKRAQTFHAMGVMRPEGGTVKMVEGGLEDKSPEVRTAAATSLGEMRATASISKLQAAVDDKDFGVSVAAAQALVLMKNDAGYDADYEMLTGSRKSGEPLTQQAQSMLHDCDKMLFLAFEEGMGFVPFGGIGVAAYTTLRKDTAGPIRANAALALAHDSDPRSGQALVIATGDKDWIVRSAAIKAIALRGDISLLKELAEPLEDKVAAVRYQAAASIIRLSQASGSTTAAR